MSERKSQYLLDELGNFIPRKSKHEVVKARAHTCLSNAVNLMDFIKSNYTDEQYDELLKKFFLSVKSGDINKFIRKLSEIEKS